MSRTGHALVAAVGAACTIRRPRCRCARRASRAAAALAPVSAATPVPGSEREVAAGPPPCAGTERRQLLLRCSEHEVAAGPPPGTGTERRRLLLRCCAGPLVGLAGGAAWAALPAGAAGRSVGPPPAGQEGARARLLAAIAADEGVEEAIEALVQFDPAEGQGARARALAGTWRLLWSSSAAEVSRVLRAVPAPLAPTSLQLLGDAGIGPGRGANVLDFLGGLIRLELSSAAVPSGADASSVVIGPPFRLALLAGGGRLPLGAEEDESSDTTPLLGNQKSIFRQRYLETSGAAGDLKISSVVSGDPVVVGSAFVHQRL